MWWYNVWNYNFRVLSFIEKIKTQWAVSNFQKLSWLEWIKISETFNWKIHFNEQIGTAFLTLQKSLPVFTFFHCIVLWAVNSTVGLQETGTHVKSVIILLLAFLQPYFLVMFFWKYQLFQKYFGFFKKILHWTGWRLLWEQIYQNF